MVKNIFITLFFTVFFVGCTSTRDQLQDALENKDVERFVSILKTDPDITNLTDFRDQNESNILHIMVEKNSLDAFRFIGSNPSYTIPYNYYNNDYLTPLGEASKLGRCQLAELFMIKGANPMVIPSQHVPAIVNAFEGNSPACVESIAIHSPEAVNQEVADGWKPIHYAAYIGNIDALKVLFKYHPEPDDKVSIEKGAPNFSKKGFSLIGDVNAYQIAILMGHVEAAKILLKYFPTYIYGKTNVGYTDMQLAEISGFPSIIAWVSSIEPRINLNDPKVKNIEPKDTNSLSSQSSRKISSLEPEKLEN